MPITTNLTLRKNITRPLTWLEGDGNFETLLANDQALQAEKQPINAKLTVLAASVWAANQLQYQTAAGTVANTPFTVAARALLDDPDHPAMRVTLGLGGQILQALQALTMVANGVPYFASATTMAVQASSSFGRGLLNLANGPAGRAAFGALGEGDFGIGNALTLAGGTNLNSLTTPGTYAFTSGSALVNSPYGAACYVEVYGRAAYPWQIVSPIYGTGDTYWTRYAKVANPTTSAADWGPWLPTKLGNFGIGERQSPDTTDAEMSSTTADGGLLNGMSRLIVGGTAGGFYKGLPNQDTYAITTNRGSTGVYAHQIASGHAVNRLYFRRASSVDFEPLTKAGDYGWGPGGELNNALGASGTNLNDVLVPGSYGQNANANASLALNYPLAVAGNLLVQGSSSSITSQQYNTYNDGRVFVRSRYATAWSAWKEIYTTGSILGAVSQSGGTPTGAIIERGQNTNGQFVKYADGTMECWAQVRAIFVQTDILAVTWTFPVAFSNDVVVEVTPIQGSIADMTPGFRDIGSAMAAVVGLTSCSPRVHLTRGAAASFAAGNFINLGCFAKGRWF